MSAQVESAKDWASYAFSFIRAIVDIAIYTSGAYVLAKLFRLLLIALHNLSNEERLSYEFLYSNWGVFYRNAELSTLLSHLVFAPLVETAVFCVAIWKGCAHLRLSVGVFIACSVAAFAALHLQLGLFTAMSAAMVGLFIALVFVKYVNRHTVIAFWMAALTHSAYNALVGLA